MLKGPPKICVCLRFLQCQLAIPVYHSHIQIGLSPDAAASDTVPSYADSEASPHYKRARNDPAPSALCQAFMQSHSPLLLSLSQSQAAQSRENVAVATSSLLCNLPSHPPAVQKFYCGHFFLSPSHSLAWKNVLFHSTSRPSPPTFLCLCGEATYIIALQPSHEKYPLSYFLKKCSL